MPALISIQQVLQQLVQNQPVAALILASAPPVVEPREALAEGVTLDADNLSAMWHPASMAEDPTIFVTRVE